MVAGVTDYHTEYQETRAGDFPVVSKDMTLLAGQVYVEGSILALLKGGANDGKLVMATNQGAPTDGSADIFAYLPYPVDATNADAPARVNISGEISDLTAVFKSGGYTATTAEKYLRSINRPIFIHRVTPLLEVEE